MHVAQGPHDLRCRHDHDAAAGHCQLCLPLMAYGDVLGLLTIGQDAVHDTQAAADTLALKARQIAEQVALSLSNAKLRQVLRNQSIKDPLTGLFNRRYMEETMTREIIRAQRKSLPLAVIVADLDHFKKLNDTHGHPAGDAVLKAAAGQMQRSVRGSDVACRFGGEEFVLILPDCTREVAATKAQELCDRLRRLTVPVDGETLSVTGSFGVAGFPEDGASGADLVEAADQALYRAKRAGRDRICLAGQPPRDSTPPAA
jgi:diguanylate cyclase (GGDEF)-like protein